MARRVVVIGAGPGGLAASLLLARAGLDVTILERLPRVGGRTSCIEEDGFRFDLGPTFFLFPLALERILAAIGRNLRDEVPMVRLDPQYHLIFGAGGDLMATPDVVRMREQIAQISAADAQSFQRFLDENRVKLSRFQPALESPFLGWSSVLRWDMLKMLPVLRPWLSLDAELGRYFSDPRIRLAFSFQSKYLGMSPFRCPSLFSILSFLEYEHGVHHPIGGCATVSERMAEIAEEMGVTFRLGTEVREVICSGRQAVAVRTDDGEFPCDALVINADFAQAMSRLVPNQNRRRWTDAKLEQKKYSCSTFMMYLGIDGLYDKLAHHTIYMAKDYERNLRDIEIDHRLSEDPSLYIQNAGVTDESLAPEGRSTLYVLAPVSHQHANIDWTVEKARFRQTVINQLKKRLGLTDIETRIRFEKVITPMNWENDYAIYRGATFNLAHNWSQMLHFRPRNRFEDLEGVYLVGGGTHPGSGLPVIYESARISSRLLLDDLGVRRTWIDAFEPLVSSPV